jgi:hypothetical protein
MPGILCVFTWGLSATPFTLATSAIFSTFLSIFAPSIKTYGDPEEFGIGSLELRIVCSFGTVSNFEILTSLFFHTSLFIIYFVIVVRMAIPNSKLLIHNSTNGFSIVRPSIRCPSCKSSL